MSHDIAPYIVHEALLVDHRTDGKRSGEGCIEVLSDQSLLAIYGRFDGAKDHDPAKLLKQQSADGGKTWSKPKSFIAIPPGIQNLMSLSLLRLADGRLGAIYLQKQSNLDCRPRFITSKNDGRTWSKPVPVITDKDMGYYVANNDRLVQLASGRLIVPVSFHSKDGTQSLNPGIAQCCYSDDAGQTWRMGRRIGIEKKNVLAPKALDKTNAAVVKVFKDKILVCQEPGVVEVPDGRLMMWCRTNGGYAYHAFSSDAGETFSPFKAISEFAMPCGPQSIKRLPGTDRLVMLYNDRGNLALGSPQFQWRRTLDVAVSDDSGQSWRRLGLLEPDTVPSTCYYSICFHKKNAVFMYYEGVMRTTDTGLFTPRNLASLKIKIIKQDYFKL